MIEGETLLGFESVREEIGLAAALPALVARVLERGGRALDLVGVAVGPGSFTGLRAGISVATGVALALGIPVVGVSVAEALAEGLQAQGRTVWTAIEARRGFISLDCGHGFQTCPETSIRAAAGPIAVCGNASNLVAAALAARGGDVMLTQARVPAAWQVAAVAVRRQEGALPPLAASPLYVEAPQAKLPAGGLRAAPV